jgi:transcriptional regulator with XRE-family HTH domain
MCNWLEGGRVPSRAPERRLFDAEGFYAALDAVRQTQKIHWKDVAQRAGVSASTLTRMAQGRRPDVDSLAALCQWGELDADEFMRSKPRDNADAAPLAMISTYLRSDPNLSPRAAEALDTVIKATYEQLREK